MTIARLLLAAATLAVAARTATGQQARPPEILLRLDDMGMNGAVNSAVERVARTGMPFSVSVLFVGPRIAEAIEILKRNPHISVGVHLALNSEWKDYRWAPVLGRAAVPTLVDSSGYFVHSTREFLARQYDLGEVERELSAQVERALASGLRIDYVDHHMGTAVATLALREVVERVAAKYGLGISRYFQEAVFDMFSVAAERKTPELLARIDRMNVDRTNLVVVHVAEATPEMRALVDMNNSRMNTPSGEPLTYVHRQAELDMLLSPEFAAKVRTSGARLVTYRDVIAARGLASMTRPGG